MRKIFLSAAGLLSVSGAALLSAPVLADHVTTAGDAGVAGSILTLSPQGLAKGKWAFSLSHLRVDQQSFSDEFLEDIALQGIEEVHNTSSISISSFGAAYGVTDRFELSLRLPYIERRDIREGHLDAPGEAEVENLGKSKGIGDISLLGKFHAVRQAENGFDLSLIAGAQLPTGEKGKISDEEEEFETEFQPGSGAWNGIFGLAVGKNMGSWSLSASALYTLVSEGSRDTNLGNIFNFGGALAYHIDLGEVAHDHKPGAGAHAHSHRGVDLITEIFGQDQQHEVIEGEINENTGGLQVFVAPGLRYHSGQGWGLYGSFAIPIKDDLNGVQNKNDYRLNAGLTFSF